MTQPIRITHEDAATPAIAPRDYARLCRVLCTALAVFFLLVPLTLALVIARVDFGTRLMPDQVDQVHLAMWIHAGGFAIFALAAVRLWRATAVGIGRARLVLLAGVLAGLVSLDRFAGIAYPPPSRYQGICQPHPVRGWAHRPGVYGLFGNYYDRVNALGMRGPEIPNVKPPGQFRALVIGDSIAVGYLMPAAKTPADVLTREARRRKPDADMLFMNGGVAGYTTWQELDFLRNEGIRTQPDLVILVFCFNDMAELIHLPDGAICGMADVNPVPKIDYPSGLARAATTIFDDWRMRRISQAHYWVRVNLFADPSTGLRNREDLYRQPPLPSVARAWERTFTDLDALNEFCRENKLPWVLVFFPTCQLLDNEVDPNGVAPLKDWAGRSGVPYYDMTGDFKSALSGRHSSAMMMDDLHPNADGIDLAADLLLDFLTAKKLLPATDG